MATADLGPHPQRLKPMGQAIGAAVQRVYRSSAGIRGPPRQLLVSAQPAPRRAGESADPGRELVPAPFHSTKSRWRSASVSSRKSAMRCSGSAAIDFEQRSKILQHPRDRFRLEQIGVVDQVQPSILRRCRRSAESDRSEPFQRLLRRGSRSNPAARLFAAAYCAART